MIMQRQDNGTYSQIGFIKTKSGENIDKIVDKNGDVYFTQGFTREVSGVPPLILNSIGKPVIDYKIYGNTVQDGTPTPENPVEVQSVGNPVYAVLKDSEGNVLYDSDGAELLSNDISGYEIPVVCKKNNETIKTSITLDEPLRKIGDYADKIDFGEMCVVREIAEKTYDGSDDEVFTVPISTQSTWKRYPIGNTTNVYTHASMLSVISDRLPTKRSSEVDGGDISFRKGEKNQNIWFFVPFDMLGEKTNDTNIIIERFRTWLSSYPVTVYYPLANPITTSITLSEIPTFSGTTIVEVDTEIQPSDMEITYKAKGGD